MTFKDEGPCRIVDLERRFHLDCDVPSPNKRIIITIFTAVVAAAAVLFVFIMLPFVGRPAISLHDLVANLVLASDQLNGKTPKISAADIDMAVLNDGWGAVKHCKIELKLSRPTGRVAYYTTVSKLDGEINWSDHGDRISFAPHGKTHIQFEVYLAEETPPKTGDVRVDCDGVATSLVPIEFSERAKASDKTR